MEEDERVVEEEEEEQEWWSWGAGTDGQLATGKLQDEHLPHHLISSLPPPISLLSCGGAHVIALTSGGRVMTWGRGSSGQLGHGDLANCLLPKTVEFFDGLKVTHVSAGWNHSGFVSESGSLFTCGDGSFGQLGYGDYNSQCSPVRVSYLASKHVDQIACGMRHSLVLLKGSSGVRVYGFGNGKRGQLGISEGKVGLINLPQITIGLENAQVLNIYANGDHSTALSVGGHLYTWGRGFGSTSDVYYPQRVSASLSFTQAALGWNHALVLSNDRKVRMLGGQHHGALSDPQNIILVNHSSEDPKEAALKEIPGLDGIEVLQIAAGAEHSALVTESGLVMTWGWGEHGQLGLGNTADKTSPQVVRLGHGTSEKRTIPKIYCGSGYTYAVKSC